MAEKVYFGVPGNIQEIPAPKTGMGFDSNTDTEVTELVSGGRSVYRAPTSYKTFNLTWASNSDRLRHLIDMYNGQFGPGPFYFTDPTVSQENVLPARWSNAWQLAHQSNGWCRPVIDTDDGIPTTPMPSVYRTNRYVTFTQATAGTVKTENVVRTRLIRVPGKGYFLSVAGAATGGAAIKVRGFSSATNTWTTLSTFTTFTGATVNVLSDSNTNITMLELDLYLPLGSTLTLKGIALGTVDHSALQRILFTNLATNPRWAAAGSTVTVRTNLTPNPRSVGTAYSPNDATTSSVAITGLGTPTPTGLTTATRGMKVSGTGAMIGSWFNLDGQTNSATVRSIGAWFRASVSGYKAHFSGTGATMTGVTLPANTWTWVSFAGYSGYVGAYVTRIDGASANLTDLCYITGVTCEAGTTAPTTNFDGSTAATGDFTYVWSGAANASSSYQQAQSVVGYVDGPGQSITYISRDNPHSPVETFARSYILIPTAVGINPADTFVPADVIRTSSIWVRSSRTLTVQLRWRSASLATTANITTVPLTAGVWTEVTRQATTMVLADANLGFLLSSGLGHQQGDTFDIAEHYTVLGDYTGGFFDGNTVDNPSIDRYYRWTGTPNASTSIVTDEIPTDWMPVGQGVGALQFGDSTGGTLVSSTIDRIGLSLDFTEVQNVESLML